MVNFMWWKKKKQPVAEKLALTARFLVMPEVFYGGRDPVVYFKNIAGKNKNASKRQLPSLAKLGAGKLGAFIQKKWVRYAGLGLIFLIVVISISVYYLQQAGLLKFNQPETATVAEEQKIENKEAVIPEEKISESEIATTTVVVPELETATTTLSLAERELEFPQIFLTNSTDQDNDSLTDIEEEIFGTDSGQWDSDGDGYYDGQEVFNLYNPKGTAPMKIIDSGIVQEYINPNWQYRLYYPVGWQVGAVDEEANQVLISALTGDYVEVNAFKKESKETFQDWFARKAGGQKYSELEIFSNRFLESGQRISDELAAYFVSGDNIYVLIYHPGASGFIPFRQVMVLLRQSFRPSKTLVEIPAQVILP